MPAPANSDELLDLIQRSGVTDEAKLRSYVQKLSETSGIPSDPQKFAGLLVRDGLLTYFQAEQLLQGKYKRFTIGKYKVLEKLGSGGMAQVFLCEHKLMRRRVAIKVLPTAKADDPSSLERFYREARAVAAVDHPNIVRAYDIDQDENLHFLVMEYVDGTNLQDLVKKFGPLDVLRACHYIYGAAVGLQHAHEIGLVHRDIKPGNILLDRSGVVKILDMGLARFFHDEEDVLTKKYDENVLGTADYLAPEQALESHSVDIRADIYSLGATFYYLLTGSPLFPEGSVAQKLIWHQTREPRPIRSLRPEVPEPIVDIVNKMIAKDREKRFQTPAEVIAALAPYVATPIPPPDEREMPQLSPAAGGGAVRSATVPLVSAPLATTQTLPTLSLAAPTAAPVVAAPVVAAPVAPVTAPGQITSQPAVWESLDTDLDDTQRAARADTDPTPAPALKPLSRQRYATRTGTASPSRKRLPRSVLLLVAGLALTGVAAGIYFGVSTSNSNNSNKPITPEGRTPANLSRVVVADGGGENSVGTLREALSRIQPGGVISIAKARLVETYMKLDRVKHKDVTIEGESLDGRPPVIEVNAAVRVVFDADSVEGLKIRNLELDGGGKADSGILLSGFLPDLLLEEITLRGMKSNGLRLINAAGGEGRPAVIQQVRVLLATGVQNGVYLAASNVDTRHVVIRACRFEGPVNGRAGVGVRVEGPAADLVIHENRFFNLDASLSFARVSNNRVCKAQVNSNTIFGSTNGLLFDTTPTPGEPPGRFELAINQNYWAQTTNIGMFVGPGPPAGLAPAHNGHGPGCGPGNVTPPLAAPASHQQLPATDPNTEATFLRFPGGPPEVDGKKVGVP